jgi:hypothetical protein
MCNTLKLEGVVYCYVVSVLGAYTHPAYEWNYIYECTVKVYDLLKGKTALVKFV